MRRMLMAAVAAAVLGLPGTASAAIPSVFGGAVSCAVQANGQRLCGVGKAQIASWDGMPLDVSVAFPPASGSDTSWPVIGIYHGWGGSKLSIQTDPNVQHALSLGYAVFTMTDRGWANSCGAAMKCPGATYVHLMHDAYEVRDAQYALGLLADDGVIDPQRIGATGGSYGGAMAIALGALRNRVQLTDGTLVPWTSPAGKPMQIAATAPEFTWSDIDAALVPNGSTLDYVSNASYRGPQGDRRIGVQKQSWNTNLYFGGLQVGGYYAPAGTDPAADISGWKAITDTGGPFDNNAAAQAMTDELARNHSAFYIDDSVPPAPALLSNGWDDDLFPVDESIRYYNKVRADWPSQPIAMFHLDFGHNPRSASPPAADVTALTVAQDAWFNHFLKGAPTPADAVGGVDILTSRCPVTVAGTHYHAPSWAQLAPGEVRLDTSGTQTIAAPGSPLSNTFTSGTVCTTTSSTDTPSAAVYKLAPATRAFTLAGAPTVVATLTTTGANDAVYERLYDVDPAGGSEQLIARGDLRPTGVGAGPTRQVFQLHPQAWTVQPGHVVKLELLAQDSPYLRTAAPAAPQQPLQVADLQLRLPVIEAPGTDLGGGVQVAEPAQKIVPPGYRLAPGFGVQADQGVGGTVPATLSLTLGGPVSLGTFVPGVERTYTAATTALVTSTAGDATLSVSAPGHLANGAFSLPAALQVTGVPKAYAGPVSNDIVPIGFAQPIGSTDALRTGSYSTTLTFTLSTTSP